MIHEIFHRARFAALALTLALAACDGGGDSNLPQVPARLAVVSGNEQTADPGAELPQPVVVRVEDDRGRPVKGQVVNFVVTQGGGSVYAGTAITNSDGEARERWTVGTSPGQRLEARAVDDETGEPLLFATFTAKLTGEGTAADVRRNTQLPQPLLALPGATVADSLSVIVRDRFGGAVQGAAVTWTADNGAAVSPATSVTGANGVAKAQLTLGTAGGVTYTATAAVAGLSPVQWTAQAMTPGTLSQSFSLPFESPLPAPGEVLAPVFLAVLARSSQGAGMPGVPITYTVTAGGGSVSPAQTVTGADGSAAATLTLGPQAGTNTVRVSAPGFQPIHISFSTLARVPFGSVRVVPDTVRLSVGGRDTLHARVLDAGGAVIPEPPFNIVLAPWTINFTFQNRVPSVVEIDPLFDPLGGGNNTRLQVRALAPGQGWVVGRLSGLPYYVTGAGADLGVHADSTFVIVQ